jgi:S-adenosylmethionine-diacylgycerolhomoserine-N-methlytransferase
MSAEKMDAMYRIQRHFYDLTRKPYLLGRDTLIRSLAVPPAGTVLEIGCGTARNLVHVAKVYPSSRCYGADISAAMLKTAAATIRRNGLDARIVLAQADATNFDPRALFGIGGFDRIVISYALSMMPEWECVLESAMGLLNAGGSLHIGDFGDQAGLPDWFRSALRSWLKVFSVVPRTELAGKASRMAETSGYGFSFRTLYRGYAFLAEIRAQALTP